MSPTQPAPKERATVGDCNKTNRAALYIQVLPARGILAARIKRIISPLIQGNAFAQTKAEAVYIAKMVPFFEAYETPFLDHLYSEYNNSWLTCVLGSSVGFQGVRAQ